VNNLDKLKAIFAVRWQSFQPEEVLSPDGLKLVHNQGVFPLQYSALDKLQAFREHLDKPFIINSENHKRRGWRSVKENHDINRYQFSFHIAGCAFDVSVQDLSPEEVAKEAEAFGFSGIGIYKTFTHIDTRALIDKPIIWGAYEK
jgi:uncharacterized protein YcbK (DUF882 family)